MPARCTPCPVTYRCAILPSLDLAYLPHAASLLPPPPLPATFCLSPAIIYLWRHTTSVTTRMSGILFARYVAGRHTAAFYYNGSTNSLVVCCRRRIFCSDHTPRDVGRTRRRGVISPPPHAALLWRRLCIALTWLAVGRATCSACRTFLDYADRLPPTMGSGDRFMGNRTV